MKPGLLIIDNYDSFTYNLVRIVNDYCNVNYITLKHDEINIETVAQYDKILFSPGPGIPSQYPIMKSILEKFEKTKSILGICLGHQAIAEHYGADVINLAGPLHGIKMKVNVIDNNEIIFNKVPSGFNAGLYHSWAVGKNHFPDSLRVTAIGDNDIIMALSHNEYDVKGVQFHPESYMTEYGIELIKNWLYNAPAGV